MRIIITVCMLLTGSFAYSQSNPPELDKTFTAYQTAVMDSKGEEAVKYLDSHSMTYFTSILDYVKNADSLKLASIPLADKFSVLLIRHLASKKEVLAFTPKSLTVFAFTHGMGGRNKLDGTTLGKAKIKGNLATAPIMDGDKKTETSYQFNLEDGQWKIDITPLMKETDNEIKELLKATGKDENEFIFGLLELMTGKAPTSSIWKKIK